MLHQAGAALAQTAMMTGAVCASVVLQEAMFLMRHRCIQTVSAMYLTHIVLTQDLRSDQFFHDWILMR